MNYIRLDSFMYFVVLFCFCHFSTYAQSSVEQTPIIKWDKTFGGQYDEFEGKIIETTDGSYIVGGTSASNPSGDKSEPSRGGDDYWIVKFDKNGNKLWDKTLGGNYDEHFRCLVATPNGGVLVVGNSRSNISGDKSENRRSKRSGGGADDMWIILLNKDGGIIWDKTIGCNADAYPTCATITPQQDFVIAGYTYGEGGDKSEPARGIHEDYWVIRLSATGQLLWNKTYGGGQVDQPSGIVLLDDNTVIVAGHSLSNFSFDKTQNNVGWNDYWLLKLDLQTGQKIWDKAFGGSDDDFKPIIKFYKGDIYLAGYSNSSRSGSKSENAKGGFDFWLLKIDRNGIKLWDKTVGGDDEDLLASIAISCDDGIVLSGSSQSDISGDKTQRYRGQRSSITYYHDYWVIKLDNMGNKLWDKTFGGTEYDVNLDLLYLKDGSYLLSGYSYSDIGFEKTESRKNKYYGSDLWLIKLAGSVCCMESIKSGQWNDPTTWSCNRIPTSSDEVTIAAQHIVTVSRSTYQVKQVKIIGLLRYIMAGTIKF